MFYVMKVAVYKVAGFDEEKSISRLHCKFEEKRLDKKEPCKLRFLLVSICKTKELFMKRSTVSCDGD